jgi:hypothetical protein
MAINRSAFSAQDITTNTSIAIQMLGIKPDTSLILATPIEPNVMFGYYNDAIDAVELYVSDQLGTRYIKVL